MTQHRPERRARTVALIGLAFEVLLTVGLLLLSIWGQAPSVMGLTLLSGVGILIWFYMVLVYHQKVLVREETFESEQLKQEREQGLSGGALFNVDDENLLLARRRLGFMIRWLLPIFTILIVASLWLLASTVLIGWPWSFTEPLDSKAWTKPQNTGMLIWFIGGAAFLCFLLSRYVVGMSRLAESRMLRAGASWLMGITLVSVAVMATLAAFHFNDTPVPERVLAKIVRGLLILLGAEFALNFILDIYRPRQPDEEPRPAFDSRLLGLFTEPGGIARSIAEAINYQFGFEVSSTWFYKLLQRSIVPLLGFGVAVLLLASCLVFVDTNEEAVIERYGRRVESRGTLGPGLHFKWPWPREVVYKVPTAQVQELKIGIEPPKDEKKDENDLILWTNKHSQEPHLEVMVATPRLASYLRQSSSTRPSATSRPAATAGVGAGTKHETGDAVAVSLMRVAVSIQYKIRDAYQWLTTYDDPQEMLKVIANREINRYCASVDVDGLIGGKRAEVEQALRKTLQEKVDKAKLGIDIVFLGLQGVHPPESTAQDFQDVVGAEQKKSATIRTADAEYNKKLSEVAGDVSRAEQLSSAIREVNELERRGTETPELVAARERLNVLFSGDPEQGIPPVGGKAGEIREKAKAVRWKTENDLHAKAETFQQEMAAKSAAPQVYRTRKIMEAMISAGDSLRKYIINSNGTLQLNLQDPMNAPMETAVEELK
jgi:membrane protease subunit HflK